MEFLLESDDEIEDFSNDKEEARSMGSFAGIKCPTPNGNVDSISRGFSMGNKVMNGNLIEREMGSIVGSDSANNPESLQVDSLAVPGVAGVAKDVSFTGEGSVASHS